MAEYNKLHPYYRPVEPNYKRCNHLAHAIVSLITCGGWAPVWVLVALHVTLENRWLTARYAEAWGEHLAYWRARGYQF